MSERYTRTDVRRAAAAAIEAMAAAGVDIELGALEGGNRTQGNSWVISSAAGRVIWTFPYTMSAKDVCRALGAAEHAAQTIRAATLASRPAPVAADTAHYRAREIDEHVSGQDGGKLRIWPASGDGRPTHHLNVTAGEIAAIRAILTGGQE